MRTDVVRVDVLAETADSVVVGLQWREPDRPAVTELFQVLRLRDGKVVDMEDFERRGRALKAVGAGV